MSRWSRNGAQALLKQGAIAKGGEANDRLSKEAVEAAAKEANRRYDQSIRPAIIGVAAAKDVCRGSPRERE